jgi:hypothetical protein
MRWADVRATFPDRWLLVEALDAHSEGHRRVIDNMAVVEQCQDGPAALQRYRELRLEHPDRELYYVHTGNEALEIEERPWVGIRRNDAAHAAR